MTGELPVHLAFLACLEGQVQSSKTGRRFEPWPPYRERSHILALQEKVELVIELLDEHAAREEAPRWAGQPEGFWHFRDHLEHPNQLSFGLLYKADRGVELWHACFKSEAPPAECFLVVVDRWSMKLLDGAREFLRESLEKLTPRA